MSFGKRSLQQSAGSGASRGGNPSPGSSVVVNRGSGKDRRPGGGGWFGGGSGGGSGGSSGDAGDFEVLLGQILKIGGSVAVFLAIALGVPWALSGGLGKTVSSISRFGNGGVPMISGPTILTGQIIIRDLPAAKFERSEMTKRLMAACLPPLTPAQKSRFGRDPRFLDRLSKLGGDHTVGLGKYVVCNMRKHRQRFCVPEHKGTMLAELTVYFSMVEFKQKEWEEFHGENARVSLADQRMMNFVRAIDGQKIRKRRKRPTVDPAVVKGMRELFAEGYLAKSDFGWVVPRTVRPFLKDIEVTGAACS